MLSSTSVPTEKIHDTFKKWKNGLELEAYLTNKVFVSRSKFTQILNHLRNECSNCQDSGSFLDISSNVGYRVTITGINEISSYCRKGTATPKEIIKKELVDKIKFDDLNCNIKLSDEKRVDIRDYPGIMANIRTLNKHFRLKRRFSIMSNDKKYRYDLTIVKSVTSDAFKKISQKLKDATETYEIEMEYVDTSGNKPVLSEFVNAFEKILKLSTDDPLLTPINEQQKIREKYLKHLNKIRVAKNEKELSLPLRNPKMVFPGPQPITLETHDIPKLSDYLVTPKADGERAMLFIDDKGDYYIINNRFDVKKTGITNMDYANSVFDAEVLIIQNKRKVLLFDNYIFNNTLVWSKTLQDRTKNIKGVTESSTAYVVEEKKHVPITENSINTERHFFKTDGLIFTPLSSLSNKHPVYKWKPPHENTIDFLVECHQETDITTLYLYVGSVPTSTKDFFNNGSNNYVKQLFKADSKEKYITETTIIGRFDKCKNGDEIVSGSVIEMYFDTNERKWIPYRVREDKTDQARITNTITANNYDTALNVWKTIIDPVLAEHIIRGEKPEQQYILDDDAQYYARTKGRADMLSKSIAKFHNLYVKGKYTFENLKQNKSIFDVACGKGGDLTKWYANGFTTVIGVDLFEDNIINPNDGVYKRMSTTRDLNKNKGRKYKYGFAPFDSSKPYMEQFDNIKDDYTREFAKCLWGKNKVEQYPEEIRPYFDIVSNRFDIVSCQFALHYFFKDGETLDTFCKNVDSVIRKGGYFTGTCFDGKKVKKFIRDRGDEDGAVYPEKVNGEYMWKITRKYEENTKSKYAQEIEVYVDSIGKTHTEYLVDFGTLEKKLATYNIKPIKSGDTGYDKHIVDFEEIYSSYKDVEGLPPLTNDQKAFSFLNSWFIFKKF